jgi:hypothetical protein
VARAGIFTDDDYVVSDCLWTLANLSETDDDGVIGYIA